MSEISLFKVLTKLQRENTITNYCGLILKMIYKENPEIFAEIINDFLEEDYIKINPIFEQQIKSGKSIPDMRIVQESFVIEFETKLYDWFHEDQLINHLNGMIEEDNNKYNEKKVLFLLGKDFKDENIENEFPLVLKKANDNNIKLKKITFENFGMVIEENTTNMSSNLKNFVEEFKVLLDEQNLLEKWKYQLDVINCAQSIDKVRKGYYICPNSGNAYSHKKSRYFGAYSNKKIDVIAEIRGIVIIRKDGAEIKYKMKNSEEEEKILLEMAQKIIIEDNEEIDEEKQVFILENIKDNINFVKNTPGGLQTSKFYIDVKNIETISELELKTKNKTWGNVNDIRNIF